MATGPNMANITASLERSLQNCSLNNHRQGGTSNSAASAALADGFSDSSENHHACNNNNNNPLDDATLELNSEISLPYHWEQCLDLQTGEIYYINWRTGMKKKEDPRTNVGEKVYGNDDLYYSEEEEEEEEDEDDNSDSEESSSEESSFSSSTLPKISINLGSNGNNVAGAGPVLVVAGCKICYLYFMVPKAVDDCPKCGGQLLHFDQN